MGFKFSLAVTKLPIDEVAEAFSRPTELELTDIPVDAETDWIGTHKATDETILWINESFYFIEREELIGALSRMGPVTTLSIYDIVGCVYVAEYAEGQTRWSIYWDGSGDCTEDDLYIEGEIPAFAFEYLAEAKARYKETADVDFYEVAVGIANTAAEFQYDLIYSREDFSSLWALKAPPRGFFSRWFNRLTGWS